MCPWFDSWRYHKTRSFLIGFFVLQFGRCASARLSASIFCFATLHKRIYTPILNAVLPSAAHGTIVLASAMHNNVC